MRKLFIVALLVLIPAIPAAAQTPHGNKVPWTAPTTVGGSGTIASYTLSRCPGSCTATSGQFTVLASVSGATSFLDTNVTTGTVYTYEVQTVDTNGNISAPYVFPAYTTGTVPSNPNAPTGGTITTV